MVVLVTGANGQLGSSLRHIESKYPDLQLVFFDSKTLDITDKESIQKSFADFNPDFCINTAAYTAVDKAESEPEKAFAINTEGVQHLAEVCRDSGTILLHISTDFIFNGEKRTPYTEDDVTEPMGVYGQTKLDGEKAIRTLLSEHYIVRTSWVYSEFGNNFMKTMLRLASEKKSLNVVDDQTGTPTLATDLADALLQMIIFNIKHPEIRTFGTYNYSNEGQCSWFDFAKKIFEINNIDIDLRPIPTVQYPTPAKRPHYSVLSKEKIKKVFALDIKPWEECIKIIKR